jgi:hypothetical protein
MSSASNGKHWLTSDDFMATEKYEFRPKVRPYNDAGDGNRSAGIVVSGSNNLFQTRAHREAPGRRRIGYRTRSSSRTIRRWHLRICDACSESMNLIFYCLYVATLISLSLFQTPRVVNFSFTLAMESI